jgi:hypothetical protein
LNGAPNKRGGRRLTRAPPGRGENDVSIVRIGLAETKGFSDGYDAIFGGKKKAAAAEPKKPAPKTKVSAKKVKKK